MSPRREQEHNLAALCHLCNIVPFWGLIFCGMVWFNSRERSRYLVEQTLQAIVFHGALLGAMVVLVVVEILSRIIASILPIIGSPLHYINETMTYVLMAGYVLACMWGAWNCLWGRDFRYPLVGEAAE